jgi:hypothetical protein
VEQPDGALDEGWVVRVTADEGLGAAHSSTGAGSEDEPTHVRGPAVHGSRLRRGVALTHSRNVPRGRSPSEHSGDARNVVVSGCDAAL